MSIFIITGCSFKIPPGNYSTSDGPSFASYKFTFTENGRFNYIFSSDDGHPDIGHGGYIVIGNNILFLFENGKVANTKYINKEIPCPVQDSQIVNIKTLEKVGDPLIGVSMYNIEDHSQGTISGIDGVGQMEFLKESKKRSIQLHYMGFEDLVVEFDGDKCYDIDVRLAGEIDRLKRGDVKSAKLKREGDKILIKMSNWREYGTLYQRKK